MPVTTSSLPPTFGFPKHYGAMGLRYCASGEESPTESVVANGNSSEHDGFRTSSLEGTERGPYNNELMTMMARSAFVQAPSFMPSLRDSANGGHRPSPVGSNSTTSVDNGMLLFPGTMSLEQRLEGTLGQRNTFMASRVPLVQQHAHSGEPPAGQPMEAQPAFPNRCVAGFPSSFVSTTGGCSGSLSNMFFVPSASDNAVAPSNCYWYNSRNFPGASDRPPQQQDLLMVPVSETERLSTPAWTHGGSFHHVQNSSSVLPNPASGFPSLPSMFFPASEASPSFTHDAAGFTVISQPSTRSSYCLPDSCLTSGSSTPPVANPVMLLRRAMPLTSPSSLFLSCSAEDAQVMGDRSKSPALLSSILSGRSQPVIGSVSTGKLISKPPRERGLMPNGSASTKASSNGDWIATSCSTSSTSTAVASRQSSSVSLSSPRRSDPSRPAVTLSNRRPDATTLSACSAFVAGNSNGSLGNGFYQPTPSNTQCCPNAVQSAQSDSAPSLLGSSGIFCSDQVSANSAVFRTSAASGTSHLSAPPNAELEKIYPIQFLGEPLRLPSEYAYNFDATLTLSSAASGQGGQSVLQQGNLQTEKVPSGRASAEYLCSFPGVSWNTRMQSWLVYYEDMTGRKSKTFNPKRYSADKLDRFDSRYEKLRHLDPMRIAMHCACAFATEVRYRARLYKHLGLSLTRSGLKKLKGTKVRSMSGGTGSHPYDPAFCGVRFMETQQQSQALPLTTSPGSVSRDDNATSTTPDVSPSAVLKGEDQVANGYSLQQSPYMDMRNPLSAASSAHPELSSGRALRGCRVVITRPHGVSLGHSTLMGSRWAKKNAADALEPKGEPYPKDGAQFHHLIDSETPSYAVNDTNEASWTSHVLEGRSSSPGFSPSSVQYANDKHSFALHSSSGSPCANDTASSDAMKDQLLLSSAHLATTLSPSSTHSVSSLSPTVATVPGSSATVDTVTLTRKSSNDSSPGTTPYAAASATAAGALAYCPTPNSLSHCRSSNGLSSVTDFVDWPRTLHSLERIPEASTKQPPCTPELGNSNFCFYAPHSPGNNFFIEDIHNTQPNQQCFGRTSADQATTPVEQCRDKETTSEPASLVSSSNVATFSPNIITAEQQRLIMASGSSSASPSDFWSNEIVEPSPLQTATASPGLGDTMAGVEGRVSPSLPPPTPFLPSFPGPFTPAATDDTLPSVPPSGSGSRKIAADQYCNGGAWLTQSGEPASSQMSSSPLFSNVLPLSNQQHEAHDIIATAPGCSDSPVQRSAITVTQYSSNNSSKSKHDALVPSYDCSAPSAVLLSERYGADCLRTYPSRFRTRGCRVSPFRASSTTPRCTQTPPQDAFAKPLRDHQQQQQLVRPTTSVGEGAPSLLPLPIARPWN